MNRGYFFPILFLFLISIFVFSSKAIVDIKLQELRFYLVKEQLLNYELSSKVLREKIKQMLLFKDDYKNEIKTTILESNIMNSDTVASYPKLKWSDYYGLFLVNLVRIVSLKNFLTLVEDQNDLMQIQYAFYMERTRKFGVAAKKYETLSEKFQDIETNENGFVMLHHGFCLAMMGETEAAITKLRKTEEIFVGTHFADNARILINVLLEGEKRKEEIEKKATTIDQKAELLFENGNYKETLETLNKIENRTVNQNYMRARSLEETGQTNQAIQEYIGLSQQNENKEIAVKANRRLMLLGNIYEKNESLADFSKQQAKKLGDEEAVKQVETGSKLVAQSLIIEKLTKEPTATETKKEDSGINQEELEELKKEFTAIVFEEKKEREEKIEKIITPIIKEEEIIKQDLVMKFRLVDGKILMGKKAIFTNGKFRLESGEFGISIPYEIISLIELNEPPKVKTFGIALTQKNGKKYLVNKLERIEDEFQYKGNDSGTVNVEDIDLLIIQN